VTGGSSQRAEAALAESPRTLLRGDAGSGKTTLLQWLAVTAARSGFTGPLADWNGCVPFLVRLRSYADRPLPRPEQLLAGVKVE
jgi:predicted NACHT family NTPase